MIKIVLEVIEGDAELKMEAEKISIADLQAGICNLELVKMNLIAQLASMTDFHKEEEGLQN
jgi:hypothetical protein